MGDDSRPLVNGAVWSKLSNRDKNRLRALSVQYTANKAAPANRTAKPRGVSLEMLAQAGLLGVDPDDPSCAKLVSDISETQSGVAQFVRTLPPLRNQVIHFRESLQTANAAGHLTAFGPDNTQQLLLLFDTLVAGLDVYGKCPYLAVVHQQEAPQGEAPPD